MFTLPPVLCSERFIDPTLQAVKAMLDQAAVEAERSMYVDVVTAIDNGQLQEAVVTRQKYRVAMMVLRQVSNKVAEAISEKPAELPTVPRVDFQLPEMPQRPAAEAIHIAGSVSSSA